MLNRFRDPAARDLAAVSEHRFLYLLLSLLALAVIFPLLGEMRWLRVVLEILLLAAFIAGVMSTITHRRRLVIVSTFGTIFLITRWSGYLTGIATLDSLSFALGALFFGYVAATLILYIFADRERVDADLIYGAISVYLLLGVAFGFAYLTLDALAPGSFVDFQVVAASPEAARQFIYFSFVTLTTLGYGDITPQSSQAGVLAYVEAITGQIYLAVLVARLVGVHIAQKKK